PFAQQLPQVASSKAFSEFSALKNLKCEYKYLSYFQSNRFKVTICVTGTCACHPLKRARFLRRGRVSRTFVSAVSGDWGMSQRLGDLLVKEKIITPEQLQQATKVQKETNCRLGSALVKLNFLADEDVTNFLSRQYGVPAINLSYFEIDASVVKLIPYETAKRYQILPLSRVGASLTIAMVDPTNVFAMDDIKFMTGFNIEPVVASETSILEGIEKAYGTSKEDSLDQVMQSISDMDESDVELQADNQELGLADLEKAADEAPIVKLVNLVLTDAVKRGASDIHVEPYEKEFRVRFRIDGVMQSIMSPPVKLKDAITSRLKIMAKLDISEKRLPQDGRIMLKMNIGGRKKQLDFRVSTLPTLWGEKVVLRLLDKENLRLDMTKLGYESV